jgi:hypothetical protein
MPPTHALAGVEGDALDEAAGKAEVHLEAGRRLQEGRHRRAWGRPPVELVGEGGRLALRGGAIGRFIDGVVDYAAEGIDDGGVIEAVGRQEQPREAEALRVLRQHGPGVDDGEGRRRDRWR